MRNQQSIMNEKSPCYVFKKLSLSLQFIKVYNLHKIRAKYTFTLSLSIQNIEMIQAFSNALFSGGM